MKSKNFKVIERISGKEYVFSPVAFSNVLRDYKKRKMRQGTKLSNQQIIEQYAEKANVTVDSVHNWLYGKNGPSDLEMVKILGEYLGVDYCELLVIREEKEMTEKRYEKNVVISTDNLKDVVRMIYQKMSAFMDATVEDACYSDEESREKYEELYRDMIRTLHQSMLDIPMALYEKLVKITEEKLYFYIYGVPEIGITIWDTTEFQDFYEKNYYSGLGRAIEMKYMEQKAKKFYDEMKEILKEYIIE